MVEILTIQEQLILKERNKVEAKLKEIVASGEPTKFDVGEKTYITYTAISKTHFGTLDPFAYETFERLKREAELEKNKPVHHKHPTSKHQKKCETFKVFSEGLLDKPLMDGIKSKRIHKTPDKLQDKKPYKL